MCSINTKNLALHIFLQNFYQIYTSLQKGESSYCVLKKMEVSFSKMTGESQFQKVKKRMHRYQDFKIYIW